MKAQKTSGFSSGQAFNNFGFSGNFLEKISTGVLEIRQRFEPKSG